MGEESAEDDVDGRYGRGGPARPSAIGPRRDERATFHSTRSITATCPLASQET